MSRFDSPRWCEKCQEWGDHHTDRHPDPSVSLNGVSPKPVFVPIVLPLQEAEATALALRVAFNNVTVTRPQGFSEDEMRQVQGVYARAMVAVAEAVDKAREKAATDA